MGAFDFFIFRFFIILERHVKFVFFNRLKKSTSKIFRSEKKIVFFLKSFLLSKPPILFNIPQNRSFSKKQSLFRDFYRFLFVLKNESFFISLNDPRCSFIVSLFLLAPSFTKTFLRSHLY